MALHFSEDLLSRKNQTELEAEFTSLDEMVKLLFDFIAAVAWTLFRRRLIICSMIRPTGTHASARMIDFDVDETNAYDGLAPGEAQALREIANEFFFYDPSRPKFYAAIYGDNDPNGKHWNHTHLQACWANRTRLRREELKICLAKLIAHAETLT